MRKLFINLLISLLTLTSPALGEVGSQNDVERANYWKSKGYDFDPSKTSAYSMDSKVSRIEQNISRAAYWKSKGYDFDPSKTSAYSMDSKVRNIEATKAGATASYTRPSTPSYTRPSTPSYTDYNYRPPVGDHHVNGYFRRDGTYVFPHYKTNSDDSFWNNYSSRGNLNPYTGRIGSKVPSSSYSYKAPSYKAPSYKAPSYKAPKL